MTRAAEIGAGRLFQQTDDFADHDRHRPDAGEADKTEDSRFEPEIAACFGEQDFSRRTAKTWPPLRRIAPAKRTAKARRLKFVSDVRKRPDPSIKTVVMGQPPRGRDVGIGFHATSLSMENAARKR